MSEQTTSKVPQIRFKGFDGEWSEMPMGQLLTFKNGYNASKCQYGRGEKFINVLDIIRNDYITYDRIIGRVLIPLKEFAKNEVVYGDILFQRSSETLEEVGQANVYLDKTRPATFGGFVIRGRPLIDFNPSFFNATLKSPKSRRDITSRSGGSTRYNIGQESLEASLVRIASDLLEQGKVADFVMSVDRLIGLHRRKHDKLVTLKKAMLQKMFPQPGATTPEIRFKGFSGDWVEKTLAEISEIKTGPFGSALHAKDYVSDGIPIITTEHFKYWQLPETKEGLPQVSNSDYERLKNYVLKHGDIVFSRVGSIDINAHVEEKQNGWLFSGRVLRVRTPLSIDSEYLHHELSTDRVRKSVVERAVGQTMPSINTGILGRTAVFLPEQKAEQQKIGTYFRTLDSLISKHAIQLQKLQQIKSACLEKMFV